jgi:hypothetical protein
MLMMLSAGKKMGVGHTSKPIHRRFMLISSWLPAKSHLPTSSYSFDNLLSTKWPSIEIIPDQRCVSYVLCEDGFKADLGGSYPYRGSTVVQAYIRWETWQPLFDT